MKSRWAIIWAVVLILGGAFLLAQNFNVFGELSAPIWSVIFGGLGVLFLLNFLTARDQWWSLIPGCILLGLGLISFLAEVGEVKGEWMGSLFLFSVGLPFLLIYLVQASQGHKEFWWALIPGGILTVMAIIVLAASSVPGEVIGMLILWCIALSFVWVYLSDRRQNWWALIPGGVMFVAGLMPGLVLLNDSPRLIGGVFFLGLAAVFGLLYFLNPTGQEKKWAVYPASVLAVIGLGAVILGRDWWPVVIIALGVFLLINALRRGP